MGGNQDSYRKMWHIMMTGRQSHVVKRVDRLSGLRVIRWWFGWLAWKMICWEAEWKKMFFFEKPLGSFTSKTQAMKEDQMHHLQWGKKIAKLKVTRPQEWQNYLICQETQTNNQDLLSLQWWCRSIPFLCHKWLDHETSLWKRPKCPGWRRWLKTLGGGLSALNCEL